MRKYLVSLILVASFSIGFAAEPAKAPVKDNYVVPVQKILGAEKPIVLGEMVELSLSKVELVAPLSAINQEWKVYDVEKGKDGIVKPVDKPTKTYGCDDKDKVVAFGSGVKDKTLFVSVAVTYLYIVKEADGKVSKVATKTVILTANITIGNGGTGPPTPPDPVIPDVIPEGKFGLTKFVYDSLTKNMTKARGTAAKLVALEYDTVVTRVRAGTLKDPTDILKTAGENATKAIKDLDYDKDGWSKASDAVQNQLYELYQSGKLVTSSDFADALESLSQGLKLVK